MTVQLRLTSATVGPPGRRFSAVLFWGEVVCSLAGVRALSILCDWAATPFPCRLTFRHILPVSKHPFLLVLGPGYAASR